MPAVGVPDPLDGDAALEVLENVPLAVTVVDATGTIRYANQACADLLGTTRETLVGASALSMTVGASDTTAAIDVAASIASGQPWIGRFPLTGPDGRRVEAWYAASPAQGGGIAYVGGTAEQIASALGYVAGEDDAELRREEAEEANRLVTTLLDAVPIGMAFFDREARMVRVNDALATIDGIPTTEHLGQTLADVLHRVPDDVNEMIARVFETEQTISGQLVAATTRAEPDVVRYWIMNFYPVRLRGAIPWVGATATEVTEWRRAEEERARLLAAEQDARAAAEDAAQRLARLQVVTASLAEATAVDSVADVVITHGAHGLGASGAALLVASEDQSAVEVIAATGFATEAVETFKRIDLDAPLPIAQSIRDREVLLIDSRAARDSRWPELTSVETVGESYAVVPLLLDDRILGAIALAWSAQRRFTQSDSDFLFALGRQCVLALERVRLYDAERDARAVAEEAHGRMAFLAEASRVLGASLDYAQTLPKVAELAVREVADACVIHLIEQRDLALVAAAHRQEAKSDLLRRASSKRPDEPRLLGRVATSGPAQLIDDVTPELIARLAVDDEHADELTQLGLTSMIVVPLVGSSGRLGVVSVGTTESPRFDADDLEFIGDLAARVSVALENSLAHEARTEVARTLQQSLLPPVPPGIPGLEIAQRYHSVGADVGGDFFDVFPAGDGRWGVVMGDVCGRGVAAASLTALARYTVRAAAIDQGEPAQVLHRLNRAILDTESDERFCTIAHAFVEPLDSGARLTLACGGHPLPLLLRADGSVSEVGQAGTAIGLFEELSLVEVDAELGRGDAIVFFTDGLTEARAPDGRFAPDLLESVLARAAGGSAEELADAIDRAVLAFEGGRPRDDMALLILRVPA
jgi:PAS domain S-box-containing protein